MVSEVLALSLNDSYWVVAEIASLNEHVSGHCYLELVEKESSEHQRGSISRYGASGAGQFKAQARATVWRSAWTRIVSKFYRETGQGLTKGMKILLQAKVSFHEVYGYSLNVSDIDPTYTLGDMARKRQEIIAMLEDDGVLDLNKELPLPHPLQRIAVISAAGAAGYGDFCQQLDESGFRFATHLFPATMQGNEVESSVIRALDAIAREADAWDCVVIIRGGGAVADLNGFETYLLAANVAQFPLPVLTGIGHERDDTVIDLVAHTRLKTPTAVAQFLIDQMREEYEQVIDLEDRLNNGLMTLLYRQRQRFDSLSHRFERLSTTFTNRQNEYLLRLSARLQLQARRQIEHQKSAIERLENRIVPAIQRTIERQSYNLELAEKTLKMSGPERILKMGYSITTDADGNIIKSAKQLVGGTVIRTTLADGSIQSQVLK